MCLLYISLFPLCPLPLLPTPAPRTPTHTAAAEFEVSDKAKEEGEADLTLAAEDLDRCVGCRDEVHKLLPLLLVAAQGRF